MRAGVTLQRPVPGELDVEDAQDRRPQLLVLPAEQLLDERLEPLLGEAWMGEEGVEAVDVLVRCAEEPALGLEPPVERSLRAGAVNHQLREGGGEREKVLEVLLDGFFVVPVQADDHRHQRDDPDPLQLPDRGGRVDPLQLGEVGPSRLEADPDPREPHREELVGRVLRQAPEAGEAREEDRPLHLRGVQREHLLDPAPVGEEVLVDDADVPERAVRVFAGPHRLVKSAPVREKRHGAPVEEVARAAEVAAARAAEAGRNDELGPRGDRHDPECPPDPRHDEARERRLAEEAPEEADPLLATDEVGVSVALLKDRAVPAEDDLRPGRHAADEPAKLFGLRERADDEADADEVVALAELAHEAAERGVVEDRGGSLEVGGDQLDPPSGADGSNAERPLRPGHLRVVHLGHDVPAARLALDTERTVDGRQEDARHRALPQAPRGIAVKGPP